MTPNDRRILRQRQQLMSKALTFFAERPEEFARVQVEIDEAMSSVDQNTRDPNKTNEQRLELLLQHLDIQARAYVQLVSNIPSQNAFITLLQDLVFSTWLSYAGYPIDGFLGSNNEQVNAVLRRAAYWRAEGYKRVAPPQSQPPGDGSIVAPRRGYRPAVNAWMKRLGIENIPQAAKRLGVSESTLKSIMSEKGQVRYGKDTLASVLEKIKYQGPHE